METIRLNKGNLAAWQKKARSNVMALGCFDGLHQGHLEVIRTAVQESRNRKVSIAVMSFFPHPKSIIAGQSGFNYLMPQSDKEDKLRKLGVDTFYLVEFDKEFASLSPKEFVSQYLLKLGVVHAVAGYDFSYGSRGAGNMDRLQKDSGDLIDVTKVEKVEYEGEKISSTAIRDRLLKGKVEEVPDLLGCAYEVKCKWDGDVLVPHSYYTIPAPGRYAVTLKHERKTLQTEIVVNEQTITFAYIDRIPTSMIGELTIEWNNRINEKVEAVGARFSAFTQSNLSFVK